MEETCTSFQEELGWEGPGMELAVLGVGCSKKILRYLYWVLVTRTPLSPLGRESFHLLDKAHRK